jgi:hypothetical protein
MHSPANCLPGAGWEPESQSMMSLADPRNPAAANVAINRYVIRKGLDRQLVLYWYQSHGRVIGSEYWSKIYLVADAVRLNRTDAAIVRVITPIAGDSVDAETLAENQAVRFVNELLPRLSHSSGLSPPCPDPRSAMPSSSPAWFSDYRQPTGSFPEGNGTSTSRGFGSHRWRCCRSIRARRRAPKLADTLFRTCDGNRALRNTSGRGPVAEPGRNRGSSSCDEPRGHEGGRKP